MNKLLDNLLTIHEKLDDIEGFIHIKGNIENLDQVDDDYKKLVDQTDLLVSILTIFSKKNLKNETKIN